VPDGFATTAEAFRDFLRENGLDTRIGEALNALDIKDSVWRHQGARVARACAVTLRHAMPQHEAAPRCAARQRAIRALAHA
jgi:hypothetical protein